MKKIILSAIAAALIAGPASEANAAAQHHHPARKVERAATREPFRNSNNAIAPAPQASWPYSGYSAPAGR